MVKVCILAAGQGKRSSFSKFSHKALLPIDGRAAISIIMDTFPKETEFVIALGHNKEILIDYLEIAESGRNYKLCYVKNYSGKFSGPATSLLSCKSFLQEPFIFTSCDTIISQNLDNLNFKYNWVGVSKVKNPKPFLTLDVHNGKVRNYFDKKTFKELPIIMKNKPINAFIGIAGIYDYKIFWNSLENNKIIINNESQISNGFNDLIKNGLNIKKLNWADIGDDQSYNNYIQKKKVKNLPKLSESIYFEKKKVIKFFSKIKIVNKRFDRSLYIKKNLPKNIKKNGNFLSYKYEKGNLLSNQNSNEIFLNFLKFSFNSIWKKVRLDKKNYDKLIKECDYFYRQKTLDRINLFLKKNKIDDKKILINKIEVPKILEALKYVPWKKLINQSIPVIFHGDPQPENIIVVNKNKFVYIDWRECFGKELEYGDIYYDFAKIHHALIVSGKIIRNNQFKVLNNNKEIFIDIKLRKNLISFLKVFENFLLKNNFSVDNVRLMTALTYLNISPLHHKPYDEFLFFFGRYLLEKFFQNKWPY